MAKIKNQQIKPREIVQEMRESYIDYAMSVIISRALPDVRDGLKPVQRRILYAMHEMGLKPEASFRKSATVVGNCLGRYHPHGDASVYNALVRMAQDFSLRHPLIKGQGNFGCFTKDTKVRLTDGRSLSFGDLVKEHKKGKRHWTFSFNPQTKKIEITEIKNPRLTREKEKIIEIILDSGEKIRCTLDHQFMLRDGSYKAAKDLKSGDSLMPAYFNIRRIRSHYNYLAVLQPFTGYYEFVHTLADEYNVRNKKAKKTRGPYMLHHKDFNKYNNSPENIERLTIRQHYKAHLKQAKNLWKERGDEFREKQRQSLKKYFSQPEIRKEISDRSKKLWEDPEYRAKYPEDHFRRMAKKLWKDPEFREFHRKKILNQWKNPEFRKKAIQAARSGHKEFLNKNPDFMKKLTKKAKISLRKKWQNPVYKERVIRSKILGYVFSLSRKYSKITPEIYEKERYNNCFPKLKNALKYFDDFSEIVEQAKKCNHKVVKTKILQKREDVYDLTAEPWHNFLLDTGVFAHNSVDGDPPSAMRYSEAKLSKIGQEMLRDIERETVDFVDNYDATRKEPVVLPSPLPQLLLNGCLGIAVGMATNIPPHNLSEVIEATIHLIDHPKATTKDLFSWIKGPDFPGGGAIFDKNGIIANYSQGRGPILIRGETKVIRKGANTQIVITEIPYQVQKAGLVQQFANLVKEKKLEGVRDIRDESDREGLRIVLDISQKAHPQKILNRLFKFTDLQKIFYLNSLALVEGIQPKVLNLKEILELFVSHRKEVVFRRTKFDLEKARARAHILEGLQKALKNIGDVIKTIKRSSERKEAQINLMKKFKLTKIQADAILEMKLSSLAKLEREKITTELEEKKKEVEALSLILKSPKRIKEIIKKELKALKEKYGDERRTKVLSQKIGEIPEEDLIPRQNTIVTLTQGGYIKRISPASYKRQKRGGKGILGMKTVAEDVVCHFLLAKTLDTLLFFTDSGKVFSTKVYKIPKAKRVAQGRGLSHFLEISSQDKVLSLIPLTKEYQELGIKNLVMATKNGIIKRTSLEDFKNVRKTGLIAIKLKKKDLLQTVAETSGGDQIILVTKKGQAICFSEKDVRLMGRTAAGVRGIRLRKGDEVIGMDIIKIKNTSRDISRLRSKYEKLKIKNGKREKKYLLVVMENGYGKRTKLSEYKLQKRGGIGLKTAKITKKTSHVVASKILSAKQEDLIVISQKGKVIRTKISSISVIGRATQGVRIMKLEEGDKVASIAVI